MRVTRYRSTTTKKGKFIVATSGLIEKLFFVNPSQSTLHECSFLVSGAACASAMPTAEKAEPARTSNAPTSLRPLTPPLAKGRKIVLVKWEKICILSGSPFVTSFVLFLHRQTLLLHWRVQLEPDLLRSLPLPVFPPALLESFRGEDRGGRHRHPWDVRRLRKFFGLPEGTVLPGGKVETICKKKLFSYLPAVSRCLPCEKDGDCGSDRECRSGRCEIKRCAHVKECSGNRCSS